MTQPLKSDQTGRPLAGQAPGVAARVPEVLRDPGPIDLSGRRPPAYDRWSEPPPAAPAPRRTMWQAAGLGLGYGVAGLLTVAAAVVVVWTLSPRPAEEATIRSADVAMIETASTPSPQPVAAAPVAAADAGPVDLGPARSLTIPEPAAQASEGATDKTAASSDAPSLPDTADPRWANAFAKPSPSEGAADELPEAALSMVAERRQPEAVEALSSILADDPALPSTVDAAPTPAPDEVRTAALAPDPVEPKTERKAEAAKPVAEPVPAATSNAAPTGRRTVRTAVNMRTGPGNSYRIVGVAPEGASVGVVRCDAWCEIVHDGKRGFVFAKFLGPAEHQAQAPAPAAKEPVEDPFNAPKRSP